MFKKLSSKEISKQLNKVNSEWTINEKGTEIHRRFVFTTFLEAFMFLTKISIYAEISKVYPKIEIVEQKVKVTFVSTAKLPFNKTDFELIEKIDTIFNLSTKKTRVYSN